MRILDLIIKKRNNLPLTQEEFNFIAQGAAKGTVPDYQLSAFLMACFLNPLSKEETAMLTKAMAFSGDKLDFKNIKIPTVDKHSTGGVGDGISLALAPLVACAGVAVPMMSGRGLGHTGGTLDKLEAMKGFNVHLKTSDIYRQIKALGLCMFGQTAMLAPADKKLYALRDASGTVESRPLITASILSKKYAEGVKSLFIDVKYGSGAFMRNYKEAKKLAKTLVETAKMLGLKCCALLTNMDTPLGRAVGNANEMRQSIAILKGDKNIAPDFYELLIKSAAYMLIISGKEKSLAKACALMKKILASGKAFEKFKKMLKWQGSNPDIADHPEKYLKDAKLCTLIKAEKSGFITRLTARTVGEAAVLLGAGRGKMEDKVNYGAGIWLDKKLGDKVKKGDIIAHIYADDKKRLADGAILLKKAYAIGEKKPKENNLIAEVIK